MTNVSAPAPRLLDARDQYLASLPPTARRDQSPEMNRFVRWFGGERLLSELRGVDIERYAAENARATDIEARLRTVRAFLAYAKKAGLTEENLSVHVRIRRTGSTSNAAEVLDDRIEVTAEGLLALQQELQSLREQRPQIAAALQAARADGDVRENAPLDAAREHQAQVEMRIRELETMLKRAVVVTAAGPGQTARLGSRLRLTDLTTGKELTFMLVGPGELNASEGKISVSSPMGKALMDRTVGEEVDVVAPSKTFRYRIDAIES